MHTHDLPKSKVLFQHMNIVSTYESFFKDVREPFATNVLKNFTYINNLSITDKIQISDMLKERAISFYNTNKEKYRWLINKHVALWFMNANEDQTHRVHKILTSGNISIGKRGITFLFL